MFRAEENTISPLEEKKSSPPTDTSSNLPSTTEHISQKAPESGGAFICFLCSLTEKYDCKGTKPPFAKDINYEEDCYVMKDPFSVPKKGEVLVLGGDCSICKKSVCLSCSIFYTKRFCQKCGTVNITNFPSQLHSKLKINDKMTKT